MNLRSKTRLKVLFGCVIFIVLLGMVFQIRGFLEIHRPVAYPLALMTALESALDSYKEKYGVYPPGESNKELVDALKGANPDGIVFFVFKPNRINQNGEVIDQWSMPLRFNHNTDGNPPVMTSAGPDRIFGTQDDITFSP